MENKKYRGVEYFHDKDGLWKVIINGSVFIVSLDDSKTEGIGRRTVMSKNNKRTCKTYIDWFLEKERSF